jgi:hypothetical protein
LKKNYFSSYKLPKQQSTSFWSQGILGVKLMKLVHEWKWRKARRNRQGKSKNPKVEKKNCIFLYLIFSQMIYNIASVPSYLSVSKKSML